MLILALECSTARGSVTLAAGSGLDDFEVRWRAEFPAGRGQGGRLFTTLESGLAETRRDGEQLGEIIVGLGPGSYSGVRQAIAAATGLALATGARLQGRSSFMGLDPATRCYHAVGDARRGTFYYAAVEEWRCLVGPELLPDRFALQARLDERPSWPVRAAETVPPGLPPDTPTAFPRADALLLGPAADLLPSPLEPIYLRAVNVTLPTRK